MKNEMRTVAKVWCAVCFAICTGLGQSETSSLSESLAAVSIPTTAAAVALGKSARMRWGN